MNNILQLVTKYSSRVQFLSSNETCLLSLFVVHSPPIHFNYLHMYSEGVCLLSIKTLTTKNTLPLQNIAFVQHWSY